MIKVSTIEKQNGTRIVYFEANSMHDSEIESLDSIYQALVGNYPKTGGYTDSNKFAIEVLIGKD